MILNLAPFTLAHFEKSKTAARKGIDNSIPEACLPALQALVTHVLLPVYNHFGSLTISSGYRSPKLNSAVGGAKASQHIYSPFDAAADIEVIGVSNSDLFTWIQGNCEFDQLILEFHNPKDPQSGWTHVSYSLHTNRKQAFSIQK